MEKGVNARVSPRGRLVRAFQGVEREERKRTVKGSAPFSKFSVVNFEAEWRSYGWIMRKWLVDGLICED